jgi:hypothetical protein
MITALTKVTITVYITLDYECRYENKGADLALVPRKCWVYKLNGTTKSYEICTIEYTQNTHPHTHEVANTIFTVYNNIQCSIVPRYAEVRT